MRHLVLGTAGHIDHGKSALVRALTGIDPDRLKEEKRRGITIELGFADLDLAPDQVVSFIDVPGHEKFVRHMVAGATGIEAVLLVVAADQGVQPQTREHLEICSLLGLRRGVVALTKCDLVELELREVVELELRDLLAGTFLERAKVVPVSAHSGEGLDDLREAFADVMREAPPRPGTGVPRLPVDRSFVLKGFGTVVTGTLISGTLREGDEIEVLPVGRRARIRGIQVHRRKVSAAQAACRTAINLQGLDCDEVPRGSTVTLPAALTPTRRIWARVHLLDHAPQTLRRGGPVRFHQGTCERAARYRTLAQGDDGALHVELKLDEETPLAPGDRFVLRRPAPVDTVGGGSVMDAHPPPAREAEPAAFAAQALEPGTAIRMRLRRAGPAGREPVGLASDLGLTREQLEQERSRLDGRDSVVPAGGRWIDGGEWTAARRRAVHELESFHRAAPLRLGMTREALRARVCGALAQDAWRTLLEGLEADGQIRLHGERVAREGHEVVLDAAGSKLAETIERRFRDGGLEPPDVQGVLEGQDPRSGAEILELLIARGTLVRIHDGKVFHAAALEQLRNKLREHARRSSTIDVAEFKRLAGVSRKHAIPLLEHLDAERTTRRVGNLREILPRGSDADSRR